MMYRKVQVTLLAAIIMMASEGYAQTDERIEKAHDNLELVMAVLSRAVLANTSCTKGSNKSWYFAIAAIDHRYAHCVMQDQRWSALEAEWAEEKKQAERTKLKEPGIGTFAYMRAMSSVPAEIRANGGFATFCSGAPWDMLLDPAIATPERIAEFKRAHPRVDIEETLKVFGLVQNLGVDRSWVDASCDREFWPASAILRR